MPTAIYDFDFQNAGDAQLVLGYDGNFYGTGFEGGIYGAYGSVFKITPTGALTTIQSFDGIDGGYPTYGLIMGVDGNFYGTTGSQGSPYKSGTVFKLSSTGTITVLHSFYQTIGGPNGLALGNDGNFYGTAEGYYSSDGIVYKITPGGEFTILHSFSGTDGSRPESPLALGNDGNFYGTTALGGAYTAGTIFKITPAGAYTTLYTFTGSDGESVVAGLVLGSDGNFYGCTNAGGSSANGTLFSITPTGTLTTLHNFDYNDGKQPTGLTQRTNGIFYGTTYGGGDTGFGTVFSENVGLSPFVRLLPSFSHVGKTIEILGQGFTGTTSVSFNGVAASFSVASDTFLRAVVPVGATTGPVTVTTPGGVLNSNVNFQVLGGTR
jgi:uncharacterized repeat protein (TIGR03803 family)